jgi:uncharacterized protein (UPF0297 family)
MENITDDSEDTLSGRILFAFQQEFNDRFPTVCLNPEFKELIGEYIKIAADAGQTNSIEQVLEFLKQVYQGRGTIPVNYIIDYLNRTDFSYRAIRHSAQGKFKDNVKAIKRNSTGETPEKQAS